MKRKILIIVLCLASVTAFSQAKKKKRTAKKNTQTQQAANQPSTANPNLKPGDTTKKQAAATVPANFRPPVDGYFKKTNILSARVTPYANLRESDVAYQKRVWREIDVREKMNRFFASPKQRLIDIFMDAIAAGELTAYDP